MKRKTKQHRLSRYLRKTSPDKRVAIQRISKRLYEFMQSEAESAAYKAWLGKPMCCR